VVTWALIAANVLAFLWQMGVGINLSALVGGMVPYEIMTLRDIGPRDLVPPPFTIFTSMFLHGGLLHLGGNLLFLWVFSPNVEDLLGRFRFLAFYLASGVAAAVAQTLLSVAAGDPLVPMVGASGAIAGVMGAYIVLFPRARVLTAVPIFIFIRFMHLPAAFFIGLWFALQMLYAFVGGAGSGVAFFAHIGGFVFGWLVTKVLVRSQMRRRGTT
jgi:membrane associated rhomboid family serine protease